MLHRLSGIASFGVAALLATAACSAQAPDAAPAADIQEGRDYFLVENPQTFADGDGIEVVEVFGYGCIHCAHLDPIVEPWKQQLPEDVDFIYVPAVFGGPWEIFARTYYTAEAMGILDESHSPMFKAAAVDRKFQNLDQIAEWYTQFGVDKDEFLAMMESFAVNAKIARAREQVSRWGVDATPTMIVAGKYRVVAPREGSFPRMLEIVDQLVEKERAAAN